MVSKESIESQLIKLGFNVHSRVNKAEIKELPHVILPDEEIYECVNGYYEGGFALLVATNIRVLLIDKKPLNFLTVEDLRYEMINQIDYSHRMMGAQINISAGAKNLKFMSYNQPRLRKLINHVQHCMAEFKQQQSQHQEGQNRHLAKINEQLQAYLLAQYESQLEFSRRLREAQIQGQELPQQPIVKPAPELADFLYSQSLLREHAAQQQQEQVAEASIQPSQPQAAAQPSWEPVARAADADAAALYAEGRREIFGKLNRTMPAPAAPVDDAAADQPATTSMAATDSQAATVALNATEPAQPIPGLEINALRIAYSRLPMALRNRKFGRPSFHDHGNSSTINPLTPTPPQPLAAA